MIVIHNDTICYLFIRDIISFSVIIKVKSFFAALNTGFKFIIFRNFHSDGSRFNIDKYITDRERHPNLYRISQTLRRTLPGAEQSSS